MKKRLGWFLILVWLAGGVSAAVMWAEDFEGAVLGAASGNNQNLAGTVIRTGNTAACMVTNAPAAFTLASGQAALLSVGDNNYAAVLAQSSISFDAVSDTDMVMMTADIYLPDQAAVPVFSFRPLLTGGSGTYNEAAVSTAGQHSITYTGTVADFGGAGGATNAQPFLYIEQKAGTADGTAADFLYIDNIRFEIVSEASPAVSVYGLSLSKPEMARDGNAVLTAALVNNSSKDCEFELGIYITKEGYDFAPDHEINPLRQVRDVFCAAGETNVIQISVYPKLLQLMWGNDRNLTAPGTYTFRVGDVSTGAEAPSAVLVVNDIISKAENVYNASYLTSNPLRDALQAVPETAIFKMPGYGVWCPSVVKVDDTWHMFCSRWEKGTHWGQSHIIRASSDSLFGPYEFQEVVMEGAGFPYAWGQSGLHNPKIMKVDGKYLMHFLAMSGDTAASKTTGFAMADSITGPWEVIDHVVLPCSNAALWIHEDGSAYAVGKDNIEVDGAVVRTLKAYRADSYLGPYECIGEGENRLPYDFEHEDPTIWWANNQYNVILTDWMGKATSEQKSVIYLTSRDGLNYKLFSPQAVWRRSDSFPITTASGETVEGVLAQIERPEVVLNDEGEVIALLMGVVDRAPAGVRDNYIMVRPVDHFVPENIEPEPISRTDVWNEDFNELSAGDSSSVLGSTKTVNALSGVVTEAPAGFSAADGKVLMLSSGANAYAALIPSSTIDLTGQSIQWGDTYQLCFDLYLPGDLPVAVGGVNFRWKDAENTGNGPTDSSWAVLAAGQHRLTYTGTFPMDIGGGLFIPDHVSPFIWFHQNGAAAADHVYIDNINFEIAPSGMSAFQRFKERVGLAGDADADAGNKAVDHELESAFSQG